MVHDDEQAREYLRQATERIILQIWQGHTDRHTKDKLCLICLNRQLTKAPWTYKPGERFVKVNRYAQGKSGRIYARKVRL